MVKKSLTLFTSTSLEYFEFSIFLFYSYVISKQYFNNDSHSVTILFVLITFLGKFFGGTLIASFIDKIGSIKIYKFTMTLTAFCTLMLLVLPDYQKIGVFAGIFFIIIRFVQVASASAEAASSIILSRENFKNKAYASSLISAAFIFGCGIANLVSNLISLEYFKYVIVASSVVLFLFRFFLIKAGLKDRFISKDNEINTFKFSHLLDVLKVSFIMIPALMLQFSLFNFKSKDNYFNMTLMMMYCLSAILFSLMNRKYLQKFTLGYLLIFIISIFTIVFKFDENLFKFLIILPFGAFMSSLFSVILDNIDSKKSGFILTMGAAIANTLTVYLLQNAGIFYIYYIGIFAIIGFLTSLKLGNNNDKMYQKEQTNA